MYIELTDHLRCPAEHDEQFLVLLPGLMEGRDVRTGELGCPVCGRTFRVADGVFHAGDAPPPPAPDAPTLLTPEAMAAFLGLSGPGGYVVLVGVPARGWRELLEASPGVGPVLVNPPAETAAEYPVSVVRGGRIPLKTRSMRGVVLGPEVAGDPAWVREAARVVLPGLRIAGEGPVPEVPGLEVLASAGGCWVAARGR
ncbi:MAG TPA: hypothetical protein VFS40_11015 [Gemmatimonadales bacterium]|nr:hypothetical protein [Gemmatimonadales bacterium]